MDQQQSRSLARLLGPTAIALAVTERVNAAILPSPDPAVVYFDGTVLLVSGLAIVLYHNLWRVNWPVLITMLGWSALSLGLFRMLWPAAQTAGDGPAVVVAQTPLFDAGVVLC